MCREATALAQVCSLLAKQREAGVNISTRESSCDDDEYNSFEFESDTGDGSDDGMAASSDPPKCQEMPTQGDLIPVPDCPPAETVGNMAAAPTDEENSLHATSPAEPRSREPDAPPHIVTHSNPDGDNAVAFTNDSDTNSDSNHPPADNVDNIAGALTEADAEPEAKDEENSLHATSSTEPDVSFSTDSHRNPDGDNAIASTNATAEASDSDTDSDSDDCTSTGHITVMLEDLDGGALKSVVLPMTPTTTAGQLKLQLQEREGVPVARQKLECQGVELHDEHILAEKARSSVVHLTRCVDAQWQRDMMQHFNTNAARLKAIRKQQRQLKRQARLRKKTKKKTKKKKKSKKKDQATASADTSAPTCDSELNHEYKRERQPKNHLARTVREYCTH